MAPPLSIKPMCWADWEYFFSFKQNRDYVLVPGTNFFQTDLLKGRSRSGISFSKRNHRAVLLGLSTGPDFTSTEVMLQSVTRRGNSGQLSHVPHAAFHPRLHEENTHRPVWDEVLEQKAQSCRGLRASLPPQVSEGWGTQHLAGLSPKALSSQDFRKK